MFGPVALDIDLHILLRRTPTADERQSVRALHTTVSSNTPFVDELDAWYILLDDARGSEPPPNFGPWHPGIHDAHWSLHRAHWLAGACEVVHGLTPSEVVEPPTWGELETTLRGELQEEANVAGGEGRARSPYWTLQLCRVLASLESRDIVRSKLDSGAWALGRLPDEAHEVIEAAMRYYSLQSREGDPALIERSYPAFYDLIRPLIDAAGR